MLRTRHRPFSCRSVWPDIKRLDAPTRKSTRTSPEIAPYCELRRATGDNQSGIDKWGTRNKNGIGTLGKAEPYRVCLTLTAYPIDHRIKSRPSRETQTSSCYECGRSKATTGNCEWKLLPGNRRERPVADYCSHVARWFGGAAARHQA